ncbi:MAG: serine hydrolase domain-containing protein, partial [Thermodesulfobacteriota bacterium]
MTKRLHKGLCLSFALSLLLLFPYAAEKKPEKVDFNGFDEFVTEAMKEWKVPGLAVSIVKDGEVIYSKGFGYRDKEKKLNVTPETLFAIGSCSKAFTAAAMGILVDEGNLEWDKPVRTYLPTFKLKDPFVSERITVLDLVCHRSGLPRHEFMWYGSSAERQELFERLQYLE